MASINISKLRRITGAGSSDISLVGPTTAVAGTGAVYTITDYDNFSIYTVEVDQGSVSRTGDTITVNVPTTGVSIVKLTVGRNNNFRDFEIAVGSSGVARPSIVYPAQGGTGVPNSLTIQATPFTPVPAGSTLHKESRFQVARDSGFTDLVLNTLVTTGNLTQTSVSGLVAGQQYYARVKYIAVNTVESEYSPSVSFTVSTQSIAKPVVTSISGTVGVGSTPTFTASAFTPFPAGSDSHVSSSWVLRGTDDSIVWQSVSDSLNKTNITIPSGVLSTDTSYSIEVQYNGGFSSSMFSDKLTFSTASSFVPDTPGAPFGGGYYAGKINVGGQIYALVVAPATLGGQNTSGLSWKTSAATTTGTDSINDGWANTQAMVTAGITAHPAANFCKNLTIGGYTDWYLPSKDELEILYRNFKPTTQNNSTSYGANTSSVPPTSNYTANNPAQTSIALFQSGQPEAFSVSQYYWSSTQYSSTLAWLQLFSDGGQSNYLGKALTTYVRGVRRVLV